MASSSFTILNIMADERLGGPQLRTLLVAEHLQKRGLATIVVTPEGDKTFAGLLDRAGIPYYQVRNFKRLPIPSKPLSVIRWFIYFIPGMISIIRLIKKHKVDVVHVNGILNIQGALATRLSKAKLVWQPNDARKLKLLKLILLPMLYLLPHRLLMDSNAVGANLLGDRVDKLDNITVIYPPVDTVKFQPQENVGEIRNQFKLKKDEKIVGIAANINPVKGYEYFLMAAKLIKETYPNVKFLIVGQTLETRKEYWQKILMLINELGIEKDIVLAGLRMDMPQIMNTMDIFVLSSIAEAAPAVIPEAMACAKPVVATRVGGIPELVSDGETGIVVPPRNPQAIAEAVLYLLNHPEKAIEMGLKGRQLAINKFDSKICVQKHEEMYKKLL